MPPVPSYVPPHPTAIPEMYIPGHFEIIQTVTITMHAESDIMLHGYEMQKLILTFKYQLDQKEGVITQAN